MVTGPRPDLRLGRLPSTCAPPAVRWLAATEFVTVADRAFRHSTPTDLAVWVTATAQSSNSTPSTTRVLPTQRRAAVRQQWYVTIVETGQLQERVEVLRMRHAPVARLEALLPQPCEVGIGRESGGNQTVFGTITSQIGKSSRGKPAASASTTGCSITGQTIVVGRPSSTLLGVDI